MSLFNIKIDFDKSRGSFIYDKTTNEKYLDFMGMYSSLPIGYNHKIFKDRQFKKDTSRVAKLKIVNCEILSDEFEKFYKSFKNFTSLSKYENYHFTCTGALANEAAIKTAMWHKEPHPEAKIISIANSFHGINSVGNLFTSRFSSVDERLGKIFASYYNDQIQASCVNDAIQALDQYDNIQGVLVEPIQSTFGDYYLNKKQLQSLYSKCKTKDIPLIFDEIQTGFCSTGKTWYFQHLGIDPDIVVFGKKSQVSGIMVKQSHSKVFEMRKKLSVTFDGDLIDMVRCHYIIKAIKNEGLKENVKQMGKLFSTGLSQIKNIKNVRSKGLLVAFDFDDKESRDQFCKNLFLNKMLCNPTGDFSVRMRPNLAVKKFEIEQALFKIKRSVNEICK
jgi:L-lysine 6-transaminase|tara:strand:+ start:6572 stop:7738 length:1167 start_codon:yes stop_codon:yes gene_type:complete